MENFFQRFKKVQGNANLSQGTCPGAELRARGRPRAFSQPACPLEPSSPFSVASVTVEFAETQPSPGTGSLPAAVCVKIG